MTTKDVVIRAALAKWLVDQLGAKRKELAAEAVAAMDVGDRKKAVLDDGTVVGSVTITDPKWLPGVTNMEALREWVEENHPSEIETPPPPAPRVRPAYVDALLKTAAMIASNVSSTYPAFDPETGELIPGIEFTRRKPGATVTVSTDQSLAIIDALEDGRMADYLNSLTSAVEKKQLSA